MNALTKTEGAALRFTPLDDMLRMASAVAESGLFGMKNQNQALALMLVAQAEGQHPATITQDYDIIQGKATRKTHSVLARFQAAGGRVEWHALTNEVADATFSHPQGGSLRLDWTLAQAKAAGLTGKDNWKNYPRAMLRARVIAEGVRAVYPAAIGGMLTPEEAQDMDAMPAKHMGAAEVIAPPPAPEPAVWPADKFTEQLPRWTRAVTEGLKTPAEIIAWATAKGVLTAEQTKQINALKPATPASESTEGNAE